MKYLLGMVLGLGVTLSGAFAQSYIIRPNGVVLTIDAKGYMYDLNQFILPYMVTTRGGQFYINDKRQITTVDENGFFYRIDKREFEAPRKVSFSGDNFFSDKKNLWTVDKSGVVYKHEDIENLGRVIKAQGRFFVVKPRRGNSILYMVDSMGQPKPRIIDNFNPEDILSMGTHWFFSNRGELFTVNENDTLMVRGGNLYNGLSNQLKAGGNFWVSEKGLFSIDDKGMPLMNNFNSNMVATVGSNYFVLNDGRLFVVGANGSVWLNETFGKMSDLGMTSAR